MTVKRALGFETEKKDQGIALLKSKDELQKAELQRTSLTRNVMVGGSVMLCIMLGLVYNRYCTKQRTNVQLQRKQKSTTPMMNW